MQVGQLSRSQAGSWRLSFAGNGPARRQFLVMLFTAKSCTACSQRFEIVLPRQVPTAAAAKGTRLHWIRGDPFLPTREHKPPRAVSSIADILRYPMYTSTVARGQHDEKAVDHRLQMTGPIMDVILAEA